MDFAIRFFNLLNHVPYGFRSEELKNLIPDGSVSVMQRTGCKVGILSATVQPDDTGIEKIQSVNRFHNFNHVYLVNASFKGKSAMRTFG